MTKSSVDADFADCHHGAERTRTPLDLGPDRARGDDGFGLTG